MKLKLLPFLFFCLVSFSFPAQKKITVWLVGDSTMSNKEIKAYPETGWGMPFSYFFDSTVVVDNRAKNGRSTKTFMSEGLWQQIMNNMNEGDYVFIQFGHNDEVKEKVGSYTTPEEFKANLAKYVNDSRTRRAIPVLLTPVSRRSFDDAGQIKETHPIYSDAIREVAKNMNVPLIDMDEKSKALLQQFGPDNSKYLFNYVEPNEHPNYPEGKKDNTHFSEMGARKIAEIVLAELKNMNIGLESRIFNPVVKK